MHLPLDDDSTWSRCPPGQVAQAAQRLRWRMRWERLWLLGRRTSLLLMLLSLAGLALVRWTSAIGLVSAPLSCQTTRSQLSSYVQLRLDLVTQARVRYHLQCCDECARNAQLLKLQTSHSRFIHPNSS